MIATERRYDIDWLRVITIGLLLIYHIAIAFQPWGVFIGFLQNDHALEWLWIPMTMLNVWRIPLLFFVSGMGVCFALRKRTGTQLLVERTRRILVPFLFGMFVIVPIHMVIWQKYYNQDLRYVPGPGHLWFLAYIFIYVIVLLPLFLYLRKNENGIVNRWFKRRFQKPLGLLIIPMAFVTEALVLKPETYELYAMTVHGFLLGLLAFLFGYLGVQSGRAFWQTLLKWRWLYLSLALVMYSIRLVLFDLNAPGFLMAIESNLWIFSVFGFAYRYLNHPGKILKYLSQAAYPVYIIHMIFLYFGSYIIFPLMIPVFLKFVLVIILTGTGCFAMYELLIRRMSVLRPLFGLKRLEKEPSDNQKNMAVKEYKPHLLGKAILMISLLLAINVGCRVNPTGPYTYQPPKDAKDVLNAGSTDEANTDQTYLSGLVNEIHDGKIFFLRILNGGRLGMEKPLILYPVI
jgi:peptidoglycan/LPS O-acetylase OafA/YrhL